MNRLTLISIAIFLLLQNFNAQDNENRFLKLKDFYSMASSNPIGNGIQDIIAINDTVIIGTSAGLSISIDNGQNWKNYFQTSQFGEESISAIAYENGFLWVALAHSDEIDGEEISTGGGLIYSTDFGNSWTKIPQPIDEQGDSLIIYGVNDGINNPMIRALPIIVPQQNVTYDINITNNTVWITSWAGGLRKSDDFGQTWERVILPPDNLDFISPDSVYSFSLQVQSGKFGKESYLNHVCFSVIDIGDSILFVGSANGINISSDGGQSWKNVNHANQDEPISANFIPALAYDSVNNQILAATWRTNNDDEFYGISSSFDFGNSWSTFLAGEKAHNFGFRHYIENSVLRSDPMVVSDNGIFRSNDGSRTWLSPPAIYDDVNKISVLNPKTYSVANSNNIIWIGTGSDGLIKFTETSGTWNGNWEILLSSEKLKSSIETYAFPNPFSPKLGSIRIKYSTGSQSKDVTIRIFDFAMNPVRTIIQNIRKEGGREHFESWDGRDDSANLVSNGVYFYRIDIGGESIFNKIVVVK